MAHSHYSAFEHMVFSSKNRVPFIHDGNSERIFSYLAGGIRNMSCDCVIVGGHREHVHLLYRKSSTLLTKNMAKELKRQTTNWIKDNALVDFPGFHWQTGYGAFSISHWDVGKIKNYIHNQKTHHQKMSWEEEYRKLLIKHGVEFDERFFLG